jgi:hypothetical protein
MGGSALARGATSAPEFIVLLTKYIIKTIAKK